MKIQRPVSNRPLPAHAKRVFKGVLFDVYQWQQKMFDGSKAVFEKIVRNDVVNIIPVTTEGKIVLSKQEQPGVAPFIGALGGRIEPGEEPLEAAKRELLEESGLEASEYLLWKASQPFEKIEMACYTFIAKGCRKTSKQNLDAGEKIELVEVSFDEFLHLAANDNYRDFEITQLLYRAVIYPHEMAEVKKIFFS